jgi:hypothetical protein
LVITTDLLFSRQSYSNQREIDARIAPVKRAIDPTRSPRIIERQCALPTCAQGYLGRAFSEALMSWVSLVLLTLVLWAACGGVIAIGRRVWSMQTTLVVHLFAAAAFAFAAASAHKLLAPDFDAIVRAAAMTGLIVALDALVVAPLFERSYAMFHSALGTWIPFAAIFLAGWAAGALV